MTDRRITTDPGAEHDTAVEKLYRETATERAPAHLDRAVLDAAARAGRRSYSRLRMWTRPAAWAAVVMLSVALILETRELPVEDRLPPMTVEPASPADVRRVEEAEAADEADRDAGNEIAERKAEAPVRKSDLGAGHAPGAVDAEEFRATDDALMERAEDMARMRQQQSDAAQPASAPAAESLSFTAEAARSAKSLEESSPACDETAREEPATWLDCIVELEEAGFAAAAGRERELLAEAFPAFEAR